MKKKSQLGVLFKLLVLLVCMASFGAWFLQGVIGWQFMALCGVIMAAVSFVAGSFYSFSGIYPVWFLLFVIATLFTCFGKNFNGYISALSQLLPVFFVFGLKSEYKEDLLGFLKKAFGVMILISLVWFILYLIGAPLPHFEILRDSSVADVQYQYSVFYFFILKTGDLFSIIIPRFQFVFYEPGYFGCLMAVFLYLNDFKFDKVHWENYVFAISLLLSLSVGGIAIGLLGYIAFSIKNRKNKFQWLVATVVLFGAFYLISANYNNGDNMINNGLLARLKYDDASGTFAGNTRFSENVNDFFWNSFVHSDDVWFGVEKPENVLNHNNVDYLSFIIRYGILALLALLYFLYYPVMKDRHNRYNLFCLALMYTFIFAQSSFSVFWAMNIILLVLGVNRLRMISA